MTQTAYCTTADVYRFVPPGVLEVPGRLVSAVSSTSEVITLAGHGLSTDQEVLFRAESGGSLPSPLVAGTTYYAIVLTADTFQVATAAGGGAINLTTAGTNVILVVPLQWTAWIAECSAMVEQTMPAHVVPCLNSDGSIPEPVRVYTAALVALRALAHVGAETAAVQGQMEFWSKQADKWGRGVPLRGVDVPASANCAITRSGYSVDPRGWDRGTGMLP
jgi:hypothetical protein